MTPEQLRRIEQLFDELRGLTPNAQAAALDRIHAGDAQVAEHVAELLSDDDPERTLLSLRKAIGSLLELAGDHDRDDLEWQRIGVYRILSLLGEGGMGSVYLAEQTEPVRRRVALKIIKRGMDSRQVLARFEAERQALALMDHPNIAHVLDAGATPDGRPYFVMEWVPGLPITDHCDRHRATLHERLAIFTAVCDAVQHAHQKGILHRDLKPGNILVALSRDEAVPKIIDFGVAKALYQPLTQRTLFTEEGRLIGTPEYMSPEQADLTSQDIDTRSDIYTLGVLLYELLTGTLPFDSRTLREAGFAEIVRIIREVEPPKPSTRLMTLIQCKDSVTKTLGACRRTDVHTLCRKLSGELDWITMKALDKERARRYQGASEFADDIRRFLNNEPVHAAKPSGWYRARKFVRRHRSGVLTAGMVVFLLLGATGISLWQADAARRARNLAIRDNERLVAVQDMIEELLYSATPDKDGRDVRVVDVIERMSRTLDNRQDIGRPVEAAIRLTIGRIYYLLGEPERSMYHLNRAVTLWREERQGRDSCESINALFALAWAESMKDDQDAYDRAMSLLEECLVFIMKHPCDQPSASNVLADQASILRRAGRFDEARQRAERAVALAEKVSPPDVVDLIYAQCNLAEVLDFSGHQAEALALYQDVLRRIRETYGERHVRYAGVLKRLGSIYAEQGKTTEARAALAQALEIDTREYGRRSLNVGSLMLELAKLNRACGDCSRAVEDAREGLSILTERYKPPNRSVAIAHITVARMLDLCGRSAEAVRDFEAGIAMYIAVFGSAENIYVALARRQYGECLIKLSRMKEAEEQLLEARKVFLSLDDEANVRKTADHLESMRQAGK